MASGTRNSPEISLGSSVSRSWARVLKVWQILCGQRSQKSGIYTICSATSLLNGITSHTGMMETAGMCFALILPHFNWPEPVCCTVINPGHDRIHPQKVCIG